jgi:uncharacterized membrane protein YdbT with pleckstrin-like domain
VVLGSYLKWGLVTVAATVGGVLAMRQPELAGHPLWLAGLLGLPGICWTYLRHATTRYKVSRVRIEVERGVLQRHVESLELWRVLDVTYRQSILDRLLGDGRVVLVGTDRSNPELVLHGLPQSRRLFEELRDAVAAARLASRPVELVEGLQHGPTV